MSPEQKNLNWACLPKETREYARKAYLEPSVSDFDRGYDAALEFLFGHNNLTNPEKPEQSVQANPKPTLRFKVGDKVTFKDSYYKEELRGSVGVVKSICEGCYVEVDNTVFCARESDLEPYTEPEPNYKYSIGQEVILHFYGGESATISEQLPPEKGSVWNCYKVKGWPHHLWHENELDPVTPEPQQTNDNMEEKELNIVKLLRKYNADKIYLVDEGEVELVEIIDDFTVSAKRGNRMIDLRDETLEIKPNGFAYIYPSKEAFLAHPLDAKKAWLEWQESRKPKRWRSNGDEGYWYVDEYCEVCNTIDAGARIDNWHYDCGNYFRTESLAEEVASQIRELLMTFHEQHPQV